MTGDEIVRMYQDSRDKKEQLKNLVDLAQMPLSEIVGILTAAGCRVEPGWREMMPVSALGNTGGRGKHAPKLGTDQLETIRRWYLDDKLSTKAIGERLGVSDQTVRTFMLKNNIPVRRGGNRGSKAATPSSVQGCRSTPSPAPVGPDFAWAERRLDALLASMAKRDLLAAGMAAGELRQWLRERSK